MCLEGALPFWCNLAVMDRRQSEVREQPCEFLSRNGPGSRRACQGLGGVGMLDTPKKQ